MASISKKFFLFLFAITIILIAFVFIVRTVGLLNNNALFIFDGARDLLWVKKIAVDHKLILIGPSSGGLQGYFQGVIWYYMLVIPFVLSGGNPISETWFMAIMSTFSVLTSFFILKKTMNVYAGILGVLFLGFSGYSVATSKFIWNPYPIVWLMPAYFLGIYLLVNRSKWGLLLISAIQGLMIHFEVIYGLGILPEYLLCILFYFKYPQKNTTRLKNILVGLILFFLPMLPSLIFDARHQFLISKSLITTFQTGGNNLSHLTDEMPNNLSKRLQLRSNDLIQFSVNSVSENKLVNCGLFALFLISVTTFLKKKDNREKRLIVLLATCGILSSFFVFLLLRYTVWGYYWIGNPSLYAMLLAFSIGYLIEKSNQKALLVALISVMLFVYKPWSSLSHWQKGELNPGAQTLSTQLQVVDTIYKDASGKSFSAYEQTPPVYDYVYRYLFWWKGSQQYHFIPTNEKQKLVYIIMEGVPEDIHASYFKNHTIHLTGQAVKTFMFGSTFPVIEKFITNSHEEPVDPNFFPQL